MAGYFSPHTSGFMWPTRGTACTHCITFARNSTSSHISWKIVPVLGTHVWQVVGLMNLGLRTSWLSPERSIRTQRLKVYSHGTWQECPFTVVYVCGSLTPLSCCLFVSVFVFWFCFVCFALHVLAGLKSSMEEAWPGPQIDRFAVSRVQVRCMTCLPHAS